MAVFYWRVFTTYDVNFFLDSVHLWGGAATLQLTCKWVNGVNTFFSFVFNITDTECVCVFGRLDIYGSQAEDNFLMDEGYLSCDLWPAVCYAVPSTSLELFHYKMNLNVYFNSIHLQAG